MRKLALLAAVTLLACTAPVAVSVAVAQQQQPSPPPERGISVVGEAESFADNDVGTFRFGVSARRRTPGAALRAVGAAVQRVIGSARASGVARQDVQTDVVSLARVRVRRTRRVEYVARNAVRVTVRQLADAGTVVDRAVGAGATGVDGPEFGVADAREIYRRTLAEAFAEARRKAERLAAEAGVALGAPLRIRESGFSEDDGGRDESAAGSPQNALGEVGTPVAPGRTRITAAVAVTFAVQ